MSTEGELDCNNCGVPHGPDDIFCENCGYDFITGSLPGPSEQFVPGDELDEIGSEAPSLLTVRVEVAVDRPYFETVVADGELAFPDPMPASQVIDLAGVELHVGRTSESKAIHPDIDIAALTTDPAVSSRHAVLRIDELGVVTVTDVGSTNGTYVGSIDSPPIDEGIPVDVAVGTPIYLGAWTRLTVAGS